MDEYNSETENNNVDAKMEIDTPEHVNCKSENGDYPSTPVQSASSDPDRPVPVSI